uniref:Salivary lipocalin n=1 Tax=Ornithodoros coriaceus TaxID=92741 RepID=B2D2B1_ORNCO|nr:salivary lipocalin [Ornithodoros coriaceus]
MRLVIFFLGFSAYGAYGDCPPANDAWRSVKSPGRYFLVKSTSSSPPQCAYVDSATDIDENAKTGKYVYGQLDKATNALTRNEGTVTAEGDKIIVTGESGVVTGTTLLLFSDYGVCDVVIGPRGDCELWVEQKNLKSISYGCCDTMFEGCAKGENIKNTYQEDECTA